jgi:hypothetical protein
VQRTLYLLAGSGGSYRYTLDREELRDQAMADGGVQVAQYIGHEQRELAQREQSRHPHRLHSSCMMLMGVRWCPRTSPVVGVVDSHGRWKDPRLQTTPMSEG